MKTPKVNSAQAALGVAVPPSSQGTSPRRAASQIVHRASQAARHLANTRSTAHLKTLAAVPPAQWGLSACAQCNTIARTTGADRALAVRCLQRAARRELRQRLGTRRQPAGSRPDPMQQAMLAEGAPSAVHPAPRSHVQKKAGGLHASCAQPSTPAKAAQTERADPFFTTVNQGLPDQAIGETGKNGGDKA